MTHRPLYSRPKTPKQRALAYRRRAAKHQHDAAWDYAMATRFRYERLGGAVCSLMACAAMDAAMARRNLNAALGGDYHDFTDDPEQML